MTLPPLVNVSDIQDRLPSTLTIEERRVSSLIQDASAAVRRFTKQDFTVGQSITNIRPIGYKLILPQRPVISVDNVQIKLPQSLTYTTIPGWYWDGSEEVWLTDGGSIINLAEEMLFVMRWQTPVCRVTYTHGFSAVPDAVIGVVCSMVTRLITAPGLGGVISESVGEYSYRLSDTAAEGAMALTKAEKDVLKEYRPIRTSTAELRG